MDVEATPDMILEVQPHGVPAPQHGAECDGCGIEVASGFIVVRSVQDGGDR